MMYLFSGDDHPSKDIKINDLKVKYLTTPEAINFDLESLDARSLDPADLKKALVTLPVIASKRVIFIRNIEKAKQQNQEIILDFGEKKEDYHIIICDTSLPSLDNAFGKQLASLGNVVRCAIKKENLNVFDMTNAMGAKNPVKALEILHELFNRGDHPLQLMPGVIWFWGKSRSRVSPDNFRRGLEALQEADINIKRSRLAPEEAVEFAVVKLVELMKQ